MTQLESEIRDASKFITKAWGKSPRFGIVLGTGAGQLAEEIATHETIGYGEIPHFPVSTAMGHSGNLVCGKLANQDVVAMQGRFHLYEGYPVDTATLPIHVMHQLGVEILFVSNAAGGMNPKMASGEIMLIESHIDLMHRSTSNMVSATLAGTRPCRRADAYDPLLIDQAMQHARGCDFPLHRGVYAAMLGPNYETRAEYRMLRRLGADVAGMSTVPEVAVAARYDIRVLGMSIITNVAKPDVLAATSGQEVIDAAEIAAPNLASLVHNAILRA